MKLSNKKINETYIIIIINNLKKFFSKKKNLNKLLNFFENNYSIKNNNYISLRLIDWFINTYSKNNKVNIKIGDDIINIYSSYKQQLQSYSKKLFDPFRRHHIVNDILIKFNNIFLLYDNNNSLIDVLYSNTLGKDNSNNGNNIEGNLTASDDNIKIFKSTLAQLLYFKWLIENNILSYIEEHKNALIKYHNNFINKKPVVVKRTKKVEKKDEILIRRQDNVITFD